MKSGWRPKHAKAWRKFIPELRRLHDTVTKNLQQLPDDQLPGFSDLILQLNAELRKNAMVEAQLERETMTLHDQKLERARRDREQSLEQDLTDAQLLDAIRARLGGNDTRVQPDPMTEDAPKDVQPETPPTDVRDVATQAPEVTASEGPRVDPEPEPSTSTTSNSLN